VDFGALNQYVAHAALINLAQESGKRNVRRVDALPRVLEQREERKQQESDDHPEGVILQLAVHPTSVLSARGAAIGQLGLMRANS
jgi:hypothetical protein